MNTQYTTQLDYVKILLEEDRAGEALNCLKTICKELETKCLVTASKLTDIEFEIPKSLIKTKPQNWVFLKETWLKLISIKDDNIYLEITDGVSIKNKFKINEAFCNNTISK